MHMNPDANVETLSVWVEAFTSKPIAAVMLGSLTGATTLPFTRASVAASHVAMKRGVVKTMLFMDVLDRCSESVQTALMRTVHPLAATN